MARRDLQLRLSPALSAKQRTLIRESVAGIPAIVSHPISISIRPELTSWRGQLLSGQAHYGTAVHAACFVRLHSLVLEEALLQDLASLRVVLAHEVFHFLWPRLGNRTRREYEELILAEQRCRARGELGESSCVSKARLSGYDGVACQARRWRYYLCESFCDTGAWRFGGVTKYQHFCLASRWAGRRAAWLDSCIRRYTVN